ncbi:DUF6318 family protein [Cryptosporangium phraense]|uniref:DUF6318 domain-containing protein n=1 Tax=Cryptosporangium phraense TaxID=2593070 RepID=A0A545AGJ7_9ACTN|nr:DUF6318 family protein [Cryptosporangium phraense]TQS39785.1 hypothetical protein FL583_38335 [Cryptosporangium phraense]
MIAERGGARSAARAILAAGLGLAALAGCANSGDSSSPKIEPSSTPSTAKVTPPAQVPESQQRDRDGAAAFTEYWFATLSYAVQTGNVDQLQKASSDACSACRQAISVIQDNYNDGGSLQGGLYTIRDANTYEDFAKDVMSVAVSYDRSPRQGSSPLGVPRGRLDGKSFADCDVRVQWTTGGWKVRGIDSADQIV